MLTSIRQSDGLKVIGELIEKDGKETYTCELCGEISKHHKSITGIRIGHFKHVEGASCLMNNGETIEHKLTKYAIFNYIKAKWEKNLATIELEKSINNKTIRPDIYLETKRGTKIAIEVQASILPVEEIIRRTEKYYKAGIHVLWSLLYDYDRFYEYKRVQGWTKDGSWGLISEGFKLREKVRLKEFELFIYWAYFKKLILWDLKRSQDKGFIVIEMSDYITDDVSFSRQGEEHYYHGKKAKVMKAPTKILTSVPFDKFKPHYAGVFKSKIREYTIPERFIFTHKT